MTFTKDSGLVKIWVRRVESGKATLDDVPHIYNLAEAVKSIIEGKA